MRAHKHSILISILAVGVLAVISCKPLKPSGGRESRRSSNVGATSPASPATPAPPTDHDIGPTDVDVVEPMPLVGNLKIKRVGALRTDLETALGLAGDELCVEAGDKSCFDEVHKVTLGGVSAYDRGIFKPWTDSPVTAPIALERIIASGCKRRLDMDREDHTNGHLLQGGSKEDFIRTTFRRFLSRGPTKSELASALQLQAEMTEPEWQWAVCFAVGTSIETMFY